MRTITARRPTTLGRGGCWPGTSGGPHGQSGGDAIDGRFDSHRGYIVSNTSCYRRDPVSGLGSFLPIDRPFLKVLGRAAIFSSIGRSRVDYRSVAWL